jgi:hypothetical protein
VDVTITIDSVSGERKINAVSLIGVIPERNDMVRIKEYHQSWTIMPAGKEMTHVILEGDVDPAGKIPDWISNMLIVDSPFKTISGLRDRIGEKLSWPTGYWNFDEIVNGAAILDVSDRTNDGLISGNISIPDSNVL